MGVSFWQALFEQARDVYEEGLASVLRVRDFSMIFDAYSQVPKTSLTESDPSIREATRRGASKIKLAQTQPPQRTLSV